MQRYNLTIENIFFNSKIANHLFCQSTFALSHCFTNMKHSILIFLFFCLLQTMLEAGPPFYTDDPEPVEYRHWEYYISTIDLKHDNLITGTLPHFEVNYGLIENVQVHLILPLNFNYVNSQSFQYGYASTEIGIKYRFIQENGRIPQIGTFPIVEMPTINNSNFNNGKAQVYLPVWLQKSWDKLTTYGGVGYWINPGTGNKNWFFAGWEAQYDFSKYFTFGSEFYYHSSETNIDQSSIGFNAGGFINLNENLHFLFSFGHSIFNQSFFSSYLGLQWTI